MPFPYRHACLLAALLCAPAAAWAGIHKWVDANGVTHYSEAAPSGQASTSLQGAPASAPPDTGGETTIDQVMKAEGMLAERRRKQAAEARAEAEAAQEAGMRRARCGAARHNLEVLQKPIPVYTKGENGERVYMEDDARAGEIESLKKAVSENCEQ